MLIPSYKQLHKLTCNYYPRIRHGNAFGRVCLCLFGTQLHL